jgi:hypothetical protein
MKAMLILITLSLFIHSSANELAWVDEQIEAIKPPREGLDEKQFSFLKDPFIFLKKNQTPKEEKKITNRAPQAIPGGSLVSKTTVKKPLYKELTLIAVINNSALINSKWYKLGEKVGKYKLEQINRTNVILTKGKKMLMLSTRTKNPNLKFKEK